MSVDFFLGIDTTELVDDNSDCAKELIRIGTNNQSK